MEHMWVMLFQSQVLLYQDTNANMKKNYSVMQKKILFLSAQCTLRENSELIH